MALDHTQFESLVHEYFNGLNPDAYETVYCPICEAYEEYVFLFQKGSQKIVRCKCSMVYSKRQPKEAFLNEFYKKSNAMKLWSELKDTPEQKLKQKEKFSQAIETICSLAPKTLLDIGCGNGEFLSLFPDHYKGMFVGLEPNTDAVKSCEAKGLTVVEGSFLTPEWMRRNEKFDCITMWGVLEHVKDPRTFLSAVKASLNPGGYILICVPNVDSLIVQLTWEKCYTFCPQHLWYFSRHTLYPLLQDIGFSVLDTWTVEPEVVPVLKASFGIGPYEDLPWPDLPWKKQDEVEHLKKAILGGGPFFKKGSGYKIVMVAQR